MMRRLFVLLKMFLIAGTVIVIAAGAVFVWYGIQHGWISRIFKQITIPVFTPTSTQFVSFEIPRFVQSDVLQKIHNQFIQEEASFIEADLSTLRLTVFHNGTAVKEVPIVAIGKQGSWWETPAGLYEIQTKEKNHLSGIGHVYMPYSMQFQGNFFIHGWPYYPNGTEVESAFSGGCIRLRTADARAIYDVITIGMPLLVFKQELFNDTQWYGLRGPTINAQAYLVADLKSNFVFTHKNIEAELPIASVTKLITSLVASEHVYLDGEIRIIDPMLQKTSIPRLRLGERITAADLFFPLLLESSNEAAYALAYGYYGGYDSFVGFLNKKAKALGMEHTILVDPAGIGSGNMATIRDLVYLAKYLYFNKSFILNITASTADSLDYPPRFSDLKNLNMFAFDSEFRGGKIGKSSTAQESMLAVFEMMLDGTRRPIVIVVLGSSDVTRDIDVLREYVREFHPIQAP
ncbi:MAG: Murein-DD-endopeptidase [Parcubacteria group bacterium GW2011_GWA1_45_7]|nr:MAG: Murein-DD-endopeptidase [Parcubacteria group bacterium GW2011_GWA1_45_7]